MSTTDGEITEPLSAYDVPPLPGERQVIWVVWATYGAFYFCRTNIAAAVPGMESSVDRGGLGLDSVHIGFILASLKLAYGFGQLLNGQLSEHLSPRKLLAVGMLGSAALNVLFGLNEAFFFLLFIWACNGYCQSLGWTPCVRVVGNWIPMLRRGKAFGIIGTGYQITACLTFIVAGQAVDLFGWRGALYVPAALLASTAVVMLLFLHETPGDHPQSTADAHQHRTEIRKGGFAENIVMTLSNPALWMLGISLGLLNACRYGFLDWGISHLIDMQRDMAADQDVSVGKTAMKYALLPLGAVAGSYLAGWATDRFFGGRRAPVIAFLLLSLSGLTLLYHRVAQVSVPATLVLLVAIGFCIYGPQVLLVGTAPADLAKRGTAAAAAGFVNFMGYMGAALGDVVTAYYKKPEHGGWQVAIYIWAGWALTAAIVSACLWNATSKDHHTPDIVEEDS